MTDTGSGCDIIAQISCFPAGGFFFFLIFLFALMCSKIFLATKTVTVVANKLIPLFTGRPIRISAKTMTSKVEDLFADSKHAALYSNTLHRPPPPKVLIDRILSFLSEKEILSPDSLAVDLGCGTGQSTSVLASHFTRVLGIDVSEAQIKQAADKETLKNVEYRVGFAESIPVEDASVNLITVSQAAHWLDIPRFYKEVDRVLVPNGVLAIYCYPYPVLANVSDSVEKQFKVEVRYIYDVALDGYWNPVRVTVDNRYRDIPLAYEDGIRDIDNLYIDYEWTLADYSAYLRTWSAFQTLNGESHEKAESIIEDFEQKIKKLLQRTTTTAKDVTFTVRWYYTVMLARKPSS